MLAAVDGQWPDGSKARTGSRLRAYFEPLFHGPDTVGIEPLADG